MSLFDRTLLHINSGSVNNTPNTQTWLDTHALEQINAVNLKDIQR
jgi:hypothetical protein